MGKRGPAPRGEFAGKTTVFSTRIRPDTRAALKQSAERSGRSLSQEIEYRLRRSFSEDEKIADVFGSRRNYALMRVIAGLMEINTEWTDDPVTFEELARSVNSLLQGLRPSGSTEHSLGLPSGWEGDDLAARAVLEIRHADSTLPLSKGSRSEHRRAVIKGDLGSLIDRPVISSNTERAPLLTLEPPIPSTTKTRRKRKK
jgi:hypothetical protein